jgi:sugar (pentulose or hexulose) kinase
MSRAAAVNDGLILAVDAGTQSIRASLIDVRGNIRKIVKTPIEPYFSSRPGWAEQEPDYYWKNFCVTCNKLIRLAGREKSMIRGVAVTTLRASVINLGKNGKPLRPAILWLDQRKADLDGWPPFALKIALKAARQYEIALFAKREFMMNWIKQNEPDIWDKTHKYLFVSGYINLKLTGEYVDSIGSTVGYVPFDYKNHRWAGKLDLKWKIFSIERSMLPDLVRPAEIMGKVSKKASAETGIPAGLPVIAAAADKACEVLGSGCLGPETACLSYGTTATVETTNERYVEVIPFLPPFPSAVPGRYNTEIRIYRGYWMVSWFKKEFGLREIEIAKKRKIAPEVLFDKLIRAVPPGSMGLVLQPYWSPGIKNPGPEAKGAIIGFGDVHTRAHIYRAILEGLAYALKEGLEKTQSRTGVKVKSIRVSGGGSQSDEAMKLTADIFDMPAERPHTYEASSLGAAIDAAVGLGIYSDFESAVKAMTCVTRVFEPEPENRDIYRELYERVFLKMYDRLKSLYEEIQNITKYPEVI